VGGASAAAVSAGAAGQDRTTGASLATNTGTLPGTAGAPAGLVPAPDPGRAPGPGLQTRGGAPDPGRGRGGVGPVTGPGLQETARGGGLDPGPEIGSPGPSRVTEDRALSLAATEDHALSLATANQATANRGPNQATANRGPNQATANRTLSQSLEKGMEKRRNLNPDQGPAAGRRGVGPSREETRPQSRRRRRGPDPGALRETDGRHIKLLIRVLPSNTARHLLAYVLLHHVGF